MGAFVFWAVGFALPAVVFLAAFSNTCNVARPAPTSTVNALAFLVVVALPIHASAVALLETMLKADTVDELWFFAREPNAYESIAPVAVAAAGYLWVACGVAVIAGVTSAHLIEWGALPFNLHHGPLYNVVRGFPRPLVIVSVLSSVCFKADEKAERLIIYKGALGGLKLSETGAIDYVVLLRPRSIMFGLKRASPEDEPVAGQTTRPQPIDRAATGLDRGRLVIEGEDLKNVHLRRVTFDEQLRLMQPSSRNTLRATLWQTRVWGIAISLFFVAEWTIGAALLNLEY